MKQRKIYIKYFSYQIKSYEQNSVSFYFSSAPQKWSLWSFVIKVIKEIELV